MSSYNLVNGTYANENKHLLMEILRGEWGFDGAVITDWGGSNDHALGVKNGSTLEMPAPGGGQCARTAGGGGKRENHRIRHRRPLVRVAAAGV